MSERLQHAFANPMTDELLATYDRLARETDEKFRTTGETDETVLEQLDQILSEHSATADTSEEFLELLRQMNAHPNRPPELDFVQLYYNHELSHRAAALDLGYIDHGFRVMIFQNSDGGMSFQPAHASEAPADMPLEDYYLTQLQILSAPGDDMSDDDVAEYVSYNRQLQELGIKPPRLLPEKFATALSEQ